MALFHELLSTPKAHTFFKATVRNGFSARLLYEAWLQANRYSDERRTLRDVEISSGEQSPLLFNTMAVDDPRALHDVIQAANCLKSLDIAAISTPAEELAFWLSDAELGDNTAQHMLSPLIALTHVRYTGGYVKAHSQFIREFRDTPFAEFNLQMFKLAAGLWAYEQYMGDQLVFASSTDSEININAWCRYVCRRLVEMAKGATSES